MIAQLRQIAPAQVLRDDAVTAVEAGNRLDDRCILIQKEDSMRNCARLIPALVLGVFAFAQNGRTIQVEVTYTGAGTVDASHKIYVALWDSAQTNSGPPVATKALDAKRGTVTFTDVEKVPAYISTAYDPTGSWAADSPPPSGSSLGIYSAHPPTPDPINVALGKTVKVKVTFDDTNKAP